MPTILKSHLWLQKKLRTPKLIFFPGKQHDAPGHWGYLFKTDIAPPHATYYINSFNKYIQCDE
jgi:hypothetical protein